MVQPKTGQNSNHIVVDLHGYSVEQARQIVTDTLSNISDDTTSIRFITGHGKKHPNKNGMQGVLKQNFPFFIQGFEDKISEVIEDAGSYKIVLVDSAIRNENILRNRGTGQSLSTSSQMAPVPREKSNELLTLMVGTAALAGIAAILLTPTPPQPPKRRCCNCVIL